MKWILFSKYLTLFLLQILVLFFASVFDFAIAMCEGEGVVTTFGKYSVILGLVPLMVAAFDVLAYFVLRKERRGCINILDVTELLVSVNHLLFIAPYPGDYEYAISWLVIILSRIGVIAYRFYRRKQDPESYPKPPQIDRPINLQKDNPIHF